VTRDDYVRGGRQHVRVPAGLRLARVRVHEIGGAGGAGELADLASLHVEPGGVDHPADQGRPGA